MPALAHHPTTFLGPWLPERVPCAIGLFRAKFGETKASAFGAIFTLFLMER